jgi:hypothetical protein
MLKLQKLTLPNQRKKEKKKKKSYMQIYYSWHSQLLSRFCPVKSKD